MTNLLAKRKECFPLQADKQWDDLFREVANRTGSRPNRYVAPLRNIVDLLKELKCQSAIVEAPYRDEDAHYDYLHDYGSFFDECSRDCARVHFLSGEPLSEHDWIDELRERYDVRASSPSKNSVYLGFLVFRPTGVACIGRSVIQEPFDRFRGHDPDRVRVIHARGVHRAHLFGCVLQVVGTPFMQQDVSSHSCAGASLWSLAYDLHRRYGTPRLFPGEVTSIATELSARSRFEDGLSAWEVARVLRKLRCAVDGELQFQLPTDQPRRARRLREIVRMMYGYVESNLPVLVGYWYPRDPVGHMVLVVGHDMKPRGQSTYPGAARGDKEVSPIRWAADSVSEFYCQDDQRGMYQPLRVWNADGNPKEGDSGWAQDPQCLEDAELLTIAPGITEAARLAYLEAQDRVEELISPETASAPSQSKLLEHLLPLVRPRLYFQRSVRFRSLVVHPDRGRTGLGRMHRDCYLKMRLPKYVYVCDLCSFENAKAGDRAKSRGEILIDATAPPFVQNENVLALRLENLLWIRGEKDVVEEDQYDFGNPPLAPLNVGEH